MCNIPAELLPFEWWGLCLQEPMGLILNWCIAITCFIAYFKLGEKQRKMPTLYVAEWRLFFLFLGFSTIFGGLGHLLFYYTGMIGKLPSWICSLVASFFIGKALIDLMGNKEKKYRFLLGFLHIKFAVIFGLIFATFSFTFVLIDMVITFLFIGLSFSIIYLKRGMKSFRYIIMGILMLIPSAIVFVFKINPHLWFNTNDMSHVFMLLSAILFYFGVKEFNFVNWKQSIATRK